MKIPLFSLVVYLIAIDGSSAAVKRGFTSDSLKENDQAHRHLMRQRPTPAPAPPPTPPPMSPPLSTISTDKTSYILGESIAITWSNLGQVTGNDWVALYYSGDVGLTTVPAGSEMWVYCCGTQSCQPSVAAFGSVTFGQGGVNESGSLSWPLPAGSYKAVLLANDGYNIIAASQELVVTGSGPGPTPTACPAATTSISTNTHAVPIEGAEVSKIAFSSCFKPTSQNSNALWSHMRNQFAPDVWDWLGDNMYADTEDMNVKRNAYNAARDDQRYRTIGPIANPKIPTTGTWDDHDFAINNMGKYYNCREQSQNEFVYHFNLPSTDPRHPAQGVNQQKGIYSAYMFKKPGQVANGVHLINLDARYDRSPTYSTYGPCEGGSSRMLSETQWTWLQNEFHRVSEIKVIGSGVQVLPPTNPGTTSFCAYDGPTGSFNANNTAVGEGPGTPAAGTVYESWAEIPQERTRLLQMAQRSINDGNAKHVIFISGDQHWAEIMAKKMPGSPSGGAPQTLYEVTASGIDQNWPYTVANTNRVRVRTADFQGDGKFVNECNFPFVYGGVTYNDCTNVGHTALWCSTQTTTGNAHVAGQWGNCLPEADELVPRASISFSNENTCTDNYLHVCSARANYGGIKVDWSTNTVKLSIFTPHQTNVEAASVTLSF